MSDKLKATAKEVEGKLQSAVGSITGSTEQKIKGEAKQVEAEARKADAEIKEKLKDATNN